MTTYCPVCGCEPDPRYPRKHRWCAVALAFGWPDPLPVLPKWDDVPHPPKVIPCPICGEDMPRADTKHGRLRQFCSTTCSNRAKGAARVQEKRDRLDDAAELLQAGEGPGSIAARLGVRPGTLADQFREAGRADLSSVFAREDRAQKRHQRDRRRGYRVVA